MSAIVIAVNVTTRDLGEGDVRTEPTAPAGWSIQHDSGGWLTVFPFGRVDGRHFHIWHVTDNGSEGAYVAAAPPVVLRQIATRAIQAWTIAMLRADNGPRATAIKAAWPDRRPHVLIDPQDPEAGTQPDPGKDVVALYPTMAGYTHPTDLEATTEVPS